MITYVFEENKDYVVTSEKVHVQKRLRVYNQTNYILTTENTFNIDKKGTLLPY